MLRSRTSRKNKTNRQSQINRTGERKTALNSGAGRSRTAGARPFFSFCAPMFPLLGALRLLILPTLQGIMRKQKPGRFSHQRSVPLAQTDLLLLE